MIKNEIVQTNDYSVLLELKEFYDRIICETIELMNLYGCKTPLEIYCLFNLINGFYVKNEEIFKLLYMKDTPIYSRDIETEDLMGIQTVLNGGVCRHRSSMLNDIYKKMGINSVMLIGYSKTFLNFSYGNSHNKQIADEIYVLDMLRKISEGAKLESFKSHLKKRKISYNIPEIHDDYFASHKNLPNHAIVMVGDDKRYYLDPMNDVTYYKDDEDIVTLRNSLGLYFFSDIKVNRFYLGYFLGENYEFMELYNAIIERPGASESETVHSIKEINSYLKQYNEDIKEFVKSNEASTEAIRRKLLEFQTK